MSVERRAEGRQRRLARSLARRRPEPRRRSSTESATPRPSTPSSGASEAHSAIWQLLDAGTESLAEFGEEWFVALRRSRTWPRRRLQVYAILWDTHVLPAARVATSCVELTPRWSSKFRPSSRPTGVGPASIRKTLTLLQGVLQRAACGADSRRTRSRAVRKPPQRRARVVEPLAPYAGRGDPRVAARSASGSRDATLVSVLAYAGLRPGEALALRWSDVRERTIARRARARARRGQGDEDRRRPARCACSHRSRPISRSGGCASAGRPTTRSSSRARRRAVARLRLAQLAQPRSSRRRRERPGSSRARPYDLRHSFVSLLIAEGVSSSRSRGRRVTRRRWRSTRTPTCSRSSTAPSASLAEEPIRRARASWYPSRTPSGDQRARASDDEKAAMCRDF